MAVGPHSFAKACSTALRPSGTGSSHEGCWDLPEQAVESGEAHLGVRGLYRGLLPAGPPLEKRVSPVSAFPPGPAVPWPPDGHVTQRLRRGNLARSCTAVELAVSKLRGGIAASIGSRNQARHAGPAAADARLVDDVGRADRGLLPSGPPLEKRATPVSAFPSGPSGLWHLELIQGALMQRVRSFAVGVSLSCSQCTGMRLLPAGMQCLTDCLFCSLGTEEGYVYQCTEKVFLPAVLQSLVVGHLLPFGAGSFVEHRVSGGRAHRGPGQVQPLSCGQPRHCQGPGGRAADPRRHLGNAEQVRGSGGRCWLDSSETVADLGCNTDCEVGQLDYHRAGGSGNAGDSCAVRPAGSRYANRGLGQAQPLSCGQLLHCQGPGGRLADPRRHLGNAKQSRGSGGRCWLDNAEAALPRATASAAACAPWLLVAGRFHDHRGPLDIERSHDRRGLPGAVQFRGYQGLFITEQDLVRRRSVLPPARLASARLPNLASKATAVSACATAPSMRSCVRVEVRLLCPVLCNATILRWIQLRR